MNLHDDLCAISELYEFPASFGQEQLWYLHELDPDSTAYNIALAFELHGELDEAALQRAFDTLIRRHDALRTGFAVVDEQLRQRVSSTVPFTLETVDLQACDELGRNRRLAELKHECARHHFDLSQASLLSVRLARLEARRHVLLLCIHHIVVDHISVLQIGREIGELYAACKSAAPIEVDEERLQFPDYVVWQREQMSEEVIAHKLEYWNSVLGDQPHTLDLPTDRVRPAVQSFAGDELSVCLPRELSAGLRRHAQREKQSLFVAVLSALNVVLHKYSGQRDLIVGCPMANRPTEEMHEVLGLFMNVLPVPVGIDPDQHFDQLAEHVRRQVTRTQALQDTPFEKIVRSGDITRSASHNPLVQVWFTFQDAPLELTLPGLEVMSEPLHNGGSKLDLSIWFWDDGESIRGLIEYNTDLYDASTVQRFSEHLTQVLRQVVERPQVRVADISLLTERERQEARRTDTLHSGTLSSMHEAFFARAAVQPESVVLTTDAGEVSAGRLAARADAIGCELQRRGVAPGDVVAVCLERDEALVAALLGVLRCGAAYLPLDPSLPAERLEYMLQDSGVRTAIAGPATHGTLPADSIDILDVDAPAHGAPQDFVPHVPGAEEPAYLMYTSGSTGRPKGVWVVHGAVGNFISAMQQRPGIGQDDVVLALTTCAFDISVLELFVPLAVGARVRLADRTTAEDNVALQQAIDTGGVTVMQATPSTWRLLRASGWEGKAGLKALVGGEALPPDLAQWLLPRVGELWNMYGPTETTIWSSCARIDHGNSATCPIGQPIWNTSIHVVDENLQLLPAGLAGELVIGGRGLSPGYHNRSELTAQRFVKLPETGETVYRTGDRGVWRDGQLQHLGRSDDQVKIRGHRIELGEIEVVLAGVPDVDVVAARVWCIDDADHRLVAYYSSRSGAPVSADLLREHARRFLPNYMLPQHFVQLSAIPLLPNGKINRNALPAPLGGAPKTTAAVAETDLTPQQRLVLTVCRELIGDDDIALDDNFFDAGGHSLLALTMMGR
ncbi:MAG: amino acid adenylation domain-containing protein, partial [Proteobacteria bacterium]|nr:amino acid adenylation domain-containing protein [Pseudomonadota bacterium]